MVGVEERLAEFVVGEAAPCSFDVCIAIDDTADAFGGDLFGLVLHFHKDKFPATAIFFVEVENGMGGCA